MISKEPSRVSPSHFYARKVGGNIEAHGAFSCSLGHRIQRGDGQFDGVYASWVWDGTRLEVHNDRYGFFPLYYFVKDGAIGLSTSIHKLITLGAPTNLDYEALSVFLRLGTFIGEDTPFIGIRAIPPATVFEWKEGKLTVDGHLSIGKSQNIKRSDAIDSYIWLFRQAIERRLPTEEFAVPLSGGRDSRHILLELCRRGLRPKFCVTVRFTSPQPDDDATIASHLTKALDLDHQILDQTGPQFESCLRSARETSLCAYPPTWFFTMADFIDGKVGTLYDGIGGDVLSAGLFLKADLLTLFEREKYSDLADTLLGEEIVSKIVARNRRNKLSRELARERIIKELRRHAEAPNPIGSFFFWNRTRRYITLSPYCTLNRTVDVFAPYIDYDLYDFLSSLPAVTFLDKTFHSETLRKAYPKYIHIPYSVSAGSQPMDWNAARILALKTISYSLGQFPSKLTSNVYVLPRLFRCLFDKKYSHTVEWLAPFVLYLLNLERGVHTSSSNQMRAGCRVSFGN